VNEVYKQGVGFSFAPVYEFPVSFIVPFFAEEDGGLKAGTAGPLARRMLKIGDFIDWDSVLAEYEARYAAMPNGTKIGAFTVANTSFEHGVIGWLINPGAIVNTTDSPTPPVFQLTQDIVGQVYTTARTLMIMPNLVKVFEPQPEPESKLVSQKDLDKLGKINNANKDDQWKSIGIKTCRVGSNNKGGPCIEFEDVGKFFKKYKSITIYFEKNKTTFTNVTITDEGVTVAHGNAPALKNVNTSNKSKITFDFEPGTQATITELIEWVN